MQIEEIMSKGVCAYRTELIIDLQMNLFTLLNFAADPFFAENVAIQDGQVFCFALSEIV